MRNDSPLGSQPHHDGSALYREVIAPGIGGRVRVRLFVPRESRADAVHVRVTPDGEQQFVRAEKEREDADGDWWSAEFEIRNPVNPYRFLLEGGPCGFAWLNAAGLHVRDVPDNADFRITAWAPPPPWAAEAIVYQVFPDRFARSQRRETPSWAVAAEWDDPVERDPELVGRQWYGGDLDGIVRHLDYLDDLGVTVIYLTPFFEAESNHRYNAVSFDAVDPLLGGDAALEELVAAAHARGIRVLGDLTTNHTGDRHEWFTTAVAHPESEERGFYYFGEDGDYASWLGVSTLPKLNFGSAELRERLFAAEGGVVARWLRPGLLDGWRIDVANMTGRYFADDMNADVARLTRQAAVAADPEALVVAEHAHDYGRDAQGDGWHGVMNYAGFTKPVWTWLRDEESAPGFLGAPIPVPRLGAADIVATMRDFAAQVPWQVSASSFLLLGSHDTTRIATVLGDAARGEAAAGLLFTLPGIPMVTYGDELGMTGEDGEDGRKPFPWDADVRAHPLREHYRSLIALRRSTPALSTGSLRWLHADGDVLAFLRETEDDRILVAVSRAESGDVEVPGVSAGAVHPLLGEGLVARDGRVRFSSARAGIAVARIDR